MPIHLHASGHQAYTMSAGLKERLQGMQLPDSQKPSSASPPSPWAELTVEVKPVSAIVLGFFSASSP